MKPFHRMVISFERWLSGHFLWVLLGCYGLAALWPGPGLWLREVALGRIDLLGQSTRLTLPMLLLALLLFNAGLAVRHSQLRHLPRDLPVLLAGLTANVLVPI